MYRFPSNIMCVVLCVLAVYPGRQCTPVGVCFDASKAGPHRRKVKHSSGLFGFLSRLLPCLPSILILREGETFSLLFLNVRFSFFNVLVYQYSTVCIPYMASVRSRREIKPTT